jgi:hypothetical protein
MCAPLTVARGGLARQETEPVQEIDNVSRRQIAVQGSGKRKGLGLGQKYNFRFDIVYEGKEESFFVEDEMTMHGWVQGT